MARKPIDPTRSKRGRASRNKGKRGELEVRDLFRGAGYHEAKRGVQFQGSPDSPDVAVPFYVPVHVEAKRVESLALYPALEQAEADAGPGDMPVVFHRRNEKPWVVAMLAEDFFRLLVEVFPPRPKPDKQE